MKGKGSDMKSWGERLCAPGWISVTRMDVSTTSRKRQPVNARTAALVAQYTLPPAYDSLPAIDPRLMTWPMLRALKSVVVGRSQPMPRRTTRERGGWGGDTRKGQGEGRTFHEELGEGNETEDVRSEHCVDVLVLDITDAVDAMSAASVVDCHDVTYE